MARLQKQTIPTHIAEHFKAHAASGKSIIEYSTEVGLSPLTFYTWRKKYRTHKSQRAVSAKPVLKQQRFSTVGTISLQELRRPLFDIYLTLEPRVTVYQGTTAQELAPFIELLSGGRIPC